MLKEKRFGRKIPLPSTMEIRRGLEAMAQADTIVAALRARATTKEEFATLLADLIERKVLTPDQARRLSDHFSRIGSDTASAV
jgi:hypothetical protein